MNSSILLREVAAFRKVRHDEIENQKIAASLHLCGIADLKGLEGLMPVELARLAKNLRLDLSRERLRGMARHRRYDLNRHIALKRLLDTVVARMEQSGGRANQAPSQ